MLSIILAFGALMATLSTAKAAGSVVVGATQLGNMKKKREMERNFRLGFNPELEKHKETVGCPPEGLELFQFEEYQLPEQMHWLCKVKFLLTESELLFLFAMARRQQLDLDAGPYAEEMRGLCGENSVSYETVAALASQLSTKMGYRQNDTPSCYVELIWKSENRLKDPILLGTLIR